jgi:ribose transport system substrate-binding protein
MKRLALATLGAAALVALAVTTTSPARSTSVRGAAGCPGLAHAQQQVKLYEKVAPFVAHGPAFDATKAKGKSLFFVQFSDAIPYDTAISDSAKEAAQKLGLKFIYYPANGTQGQWAAGIRQAIAQHAGVIVLNGLSVPLLQPELAAAARAHIPVIAAQHLDHGMPREKNVTAYEYAPYLLAGRLEADWAIASTKCAADALYLTSTDIDPPFPQAYAAAKSEFKKYCPTCKLTLVDVPITQWATQITTSVQSALNRDPKVNMILSYPDGMMTFIAPAVRTAGKTATVHAIGWNGSPFALKMVEDGDIMTADIGEAGQIVGYDEVDMAARILAGAKIVEDEGPVRLFDSTNVKETGTPPVLTKGYGDSWVKGYEKLWGVS